MKKTFLKSVVATAVVASAVALSSVVAFAASGDAWTLDATAMYPNGTLDGTKNDKPTNINDLNGASLSFWTSNDTFSPYGTYKSSVTNDTGKTWTNEACLGGSRTITITPAEDGTITVYWYDAGSKTVTVGTQSLDAPNQQVTSLSDACKKGEAFTITGSGSNVVLLEISFEPAVKTGTQYDDSMFKDATTDHTAMLPGSTAKANVLSADVIAQASGGVAFTDKDTLGADLTISDVTFGSGLLMYNDGTLRTGGKTSTSNPRFVKYDAVAGDVIVLNGCRSQNATDATRYVYLSNAVAGTELVKASAPLEETDVMLPVETAGTYYVCFSNGIQFTGVTVVSGEEVTTPSVSLVQTTVADATKVAFKGTISGNASDKTPVKTINVVTAKGYDATATPVSAKAHSITAVAPDGSDYAFIVTIDKAAVDAIPGLKVQANVVYDVNGADTTSYSEVVTYAAQ